MTSMASLQKCIIETRFSLLRGFVSLQKTLGAFASFFCKSFSAYIFSISKRTFSFQLSSFVKRKWPIPCLFYALFSSFHQLTVHYKNLPRGGFERQTSGNGGNCSANWPTTTGPWETKLLATSWAGVVLNGPILASFCLFSFFDMNQFKYQLIKAWTCNSNLGQQYGRHRRIHWAMAAPHFGLL